MPEFVGRSYGGEAIDLSDREAGSNSFDEMEGGLRTSAMMVKGGGEGGFADRLLGTYLCTNVPPRSSPEASRDWRGLLTRSVG